MASGVISTIPLEKWQASARWHRHADHAVAYYTAGSGPALLLLHGFPTAAWDFHHQWEALAQHFQVISFDMLGYGFSDKPADYSYSCCDQADIAEEISGALDIASCFVLAHDVGDSVCQELLARQIQGTQKLSLDRVLLLNGGLFPEQHRATDFQKALLGPNADQIAALVTREALENGLAALLGKDTRPGKETFDALWQLISYQSGTKRFPQLIRYIEERREQRDRWVGALQKSPVPIRLVDGAEDPVSGRHMAEYYCELIPNPDVHLLEGVGHYPQLEVPQIILDQALRYFA